MVVSVSKGCCEEDSSFTWKIIEISGDIGGAISAGAELGAAGGVWVKYGISFELSVDKKVAKLEDIGGWEG